MAVPTGIASEFRNYFRAIIYNNRTHAGVKIHLCNSLSNLPFKYLKITARPLEAMSYVTVLYKEEDHCLCFFSLAPQYDNVRVTAASSSWPPYFNSIGYQLTTPQNADIFFTDITVCKTLPWHGLQS